MIAQLPAKGGKLRRYELYRTFRMSNNLDRGLVGNASSKCDFLDNSKLDFVTLE